MVKRVYKDKAKQEARNKKIAQQKEYLPKLVLENEEKKPFIFEHKDEFEGGDFDKILTEAEKSRLIYIVLDKIRLS